MPTIRDITVSHRSNPAPARRGSTININIGAAPAVRSTSRVPARDAAASIVASVGECIRKLDAMEGDLARMRDGLDRLAPGVAAYNSMRDAAARADARHQRSTPGAVQAANAARWGRSCASGAQR